MTRLVVHTDGGARGNPGPAAIGVVVEGERDGGLEVLAEIGERIGVATNNVAEYRALIRGLEEVARLGGTEVRCLLDSQLVVEQMNGRFKVRHENVRDLQRQAADLAGQFERVTYEYVPRAQNAEADRLVNAALDGKPVGAGPQGEGGDDAPAGPGAAPRAPRSTREGVERPEAVPGSLSRASMDLLRAAYYTAADMASADIDTINRARPPGMRYETRDQAVREYLLMAGAQADLAARLGLIQPDELAAFLREFWAEQPDLVSPEGEAWIQQKLDLSR